MDKKYNNKIIESIKRSGFKIEIKEHDYLNPDYSKIIVVKDMNNKTIDIQTLYILNN